jgi:hypothetical protein
MTLFHDALPICNIDYITPNYIYTLDVINSLLENSNKIVCYLSCELWNNVVGAVNITMEPNFFPISNEYTISKLLLFNKIKELRKTNTNYNKVIFISPFYFNSIYRSDYFLFGKIYKSIINKEKISVNSLHIYRDMVHASFLAKKSIEAKEDQVVGAGELFNIRNFIKDLYSINNLEYEEYVVENLSKKPKNNKLIYADVSYTYSYSCLLENTQKDIITYFQNNKYVKNQ